MRFSPEGKYFTEILWFGRRGGILEGKKKSLSLCLHAMKTWQKGTPASPLPTPLLMTTLLEGEQPALCRRAEPGKALCPSRLAASVCEQGRVPGEEAAWNAGVAGRAGPCCLCLPHSAHSQRRGAPRFARSLSAAGLFDLWVPGLFAAGSASPGSKPHCPWPCCSLSIGEGQRSMAAGSKGSTTYLRCVGMDSARGPSTVWFGTCADASSSYSLCCWGTPAVSSREDTAVWFL